MVAARIRLACLAASQASRFLADACLFVYVAMRVQANELAGVAACLLPWIVLAPLVGRLAGAPYRWAALVASAIGLLASVWFMQGAGADSDWHWGWLGVCLIPAAILRPASLAVSPVLARECELPLNRVNGWLRLAVLGGAIGGIVLADRWYGDPSSQLGVLIGANLVALALAWPVRGGEDAASAPTSFGQVAANVWANAETRCTLLGLACTSALFIAGSVFFLSQSPPNENLILWLLGGHAAGALLASLQGKPYRGLGLVTLAALGLVITMIATLPAGVLVGHAFFWGLFTALAIVPLWTVYQSAVPAGGGRGSAMALAGAAGAAATWALLVLLHSLYGPTGRQMVLLFFSVLASVICCWKLIRPTADQLLEFVFWPMFRIYAHGPGKNRIPERGPLVIIGNHTAWFDPAWVTKITPRKVRAMMTSEYYDLPVVHFLMKHVFEAIRVQSSRFRRAAPELQEAIRLLQGDGLLLLFPEGWMRRKEERLLRQFGQGIWHILRACPNTPVVAVWIEGGWGSYTSYAGGPPTKNKKLDFWRRIDIAVQEPIVVPPEILADHRQTRAFLRQRVLEARKYLGLDVPDLSAEDEDDRDEQKEAD